jgi:hypothetical protein
MHSPQRRGERREYKKQLKIFFISSLRPLRLCGDSLLIDKANEA